MTACGSPSEPEVPSSELRLLDVSGTWSYTESFRNGYLGIACQAEGTIDMTQTGTNLSGSYDYVGTCSAPEDFSVRNSGAGGIGGVVTGRTVTLVGGLCSYSGTISGAAFDSIFGDVSCTFAEFGSEYRFNGTWKATD